MRKFSRFYRGGGRKKKEERNEGERERERGNDVVGLSNEARPSFASFAMPTH